MMPIVKPLRVAFCLSLRLSVRAAVQQPAPEWIHPKGTKASLGTFKSVWLRPIPRPRPQDTPR